MRHHEDPHLVVRVEIVEREGGDCRVGDVTGGEHHVRGLPVGQHLCEVGGMTLEGAGGEPVVGVPLKGDDVSGFFDIAQFIVLLDIFFLLHLEAESLHGLQGVGLHFHACQIRHIALGVCRYVEERLPFEGNHEILPFAQPYTGLGITAFAVGRTDIGGGDYGHGNTAAHDGELRVGGGMLRGGEGENHIVAVGCSFGLQVVDGPGRTTVLRKVGILIDIGRSGLLPGGIAFTVRLGRSVADFEHLVGIAVIDLVGLTAGELGVGGCRTAAVLDVFRLAAALIDIEFVDIKVFGILVGHRRTLVGHLFNEVSFLIVVVDILAGKLLLAVVLDGGGGASGSTVHVLNPFRKGSGSGNGPGFLNQLSGIVVLIRIGIGLGYPFEHLAVGSDGNGFLQRGSFEAHIAEVVCAPLRHIIFHHGVSTVVRRGIKTVILGERKFAPRTATEETSPDRTVVGADKEMFLFGDGVLHVAHGVADGVGAHQFTAGKPRIILGMQEACSGEHHQHCTYR